MKRYFKTVLFGMRNHFQKKIIAIDLPELCDVIRFDLYSGQADDIILGYTKEKDR